MNRVYKVIWSKAKHCYVVTSEIAKSHTKGESTGRGLKKLAAALLVAAALMGPNFAWAADGTATVMDKGSKEQIVYTQEGADVKFATKDELNAKANAADVANTYVNKTDAQVTNLTASGNVSAGSFTNGAATMSNGSLNGINQINATGNIVTTSNMRAHDITAEGDIKGNAITGTSLNTQGGTISGGAITGTTITGTSLNTQNGEINGGDIKSGGIIIAKGKITGNGLDAGSGAVEGNSLKLKGGDLDAGSGTITTTGDINGNNINANGKITTTSLEVTGGLKTDHITLGSETNNYTDINKGNVTSEVDEKVSGVEYTAESIFNKDGSSITARADVGGPADSTGKSIVGAKEISQYLGDAALPDDSKKNVTRSMVRNGDTFYMEDKAEDKTVDGKNKYSTVRQNAGERTVTVTDGENTASTNLTAADIKNTAENGMISNTAKNLVNTASENMTNTVGGNLTTTVTGDSSLTAENITNEAKNRITNKAIDVETDATSSIVQKVTNDAGSNTSTQWSYQTTEEMSQADGKTASYLRGAVEEKSELTDGDVKTTIDTMAGQTNTHITDGTNESNDLQKADQIASSVTKGTNKTVVNQNAGSLASSITDGTKVNNTNNTVDKSEQLIKVSGTQFSATSKTATKMEDALVSGDSVIDVMKNLDDAANPFIGSAVTDHTNITVVTQTAKNITNTAEKGTIANNAKDITNNATENMTNTVGKNLETTVGGEMKTTVTGNVTEGFNANLTTTVGGNKSETVTGDEKHTVNGSQTNAITGNQTNTIGGGQTTTVTGDSSLSAKNITNTATTSITDKVGDNTSWKMTDGTVVESVKDASGKTNQTTTTAADTYQFVKDGDNTLAKRTSSTNDNLNITDSNNTYTKITTATGNKQTVTDGTETASTNLTKAASNTLIKNGTQSVLNHIAADTSYTVMNENGNGSRRQQTASEIFDRVTDGTDTSEVKQTASEVAASAKDISNTATDKITSQIGDGSAVKSEMTADGITNITGKNTVISDNDGTTFENEDAKTPFVKGGEVNTKITGNKVETGKVLTDDLTVRGTSEFVGRADFRNEVYVDENLTVAKETRTDTLYG